MVVSPDIGGVKMVHAYAKLFQAPLAIVKKRRKSATEVECLMSSAKWKARTCCWWTI